eukprot:CAMPEP_0113897488 /NCGR_PEP_ID=MMETSP0780_2-20120614/18716_1 /TAXON_ID=652834 /ORGANISM="Palpitomonas bilix" /LENGTH=988 /DNA_ID=CAMNT_0000888975 /DNA_START=419 /DNA_END=3382 /DNA_ORIENTATION=- /assembly_acc=CAM_ASM_000599
MFENFPFRASLPPSVEAFVASQSSLWETASASGKPDRMVSGEKEWTGRSLRLLRDAVSSQSASKWSEVTARCHLTWEESCSIPWDIWKQKGDREVQQRLWLAQYFGSLARSFLEAEPLGPESGRVGSGGKREAATGNAGGDDLAAERSFTERPLPFPFSFFSAPLPEYAPPLASVMERREGEEAEATTESSRRRDAVGTQEQDRQYRYLVGAVHHWVQCQQKGVPQAMLDQIEAVQAQRASGLHAEEEKEFSDLEGKEHPNQRRETDAPPPQENGGSKGDSDAARTPSSLSLHPCQVLGCFVEQCCFVFTYFFSCQSEDRERLLTAAERVQRLTGDLLESVMSSNQTLLHLESRGEKIPSPPISPRGRAYGENKDDTPPPPSCYDSSHQWVVVPGTGRKDLAPQVERIFRSEHYCFETDIRPFTILPRAHLCIFSEVVQTMVRFQLRGILESVQTAKEENEERERIYGSTTWVKLTESSINVSQAYLRSLRWSKNQTGYHLAPHLLRMSQTLRGDLLDMDPKEVDTLLGWGEGTASVVRDVCQEILQIVNAMVGERAKACVSPVQLGAFWVFGTSLVGFTKEEVLRIAFDDERKKKDFAEWCDWLKVHFQTHQVLSFLELVPVEDPDALLEVALCFGAAEWPLHANVKWGGEFLSAWMGVYGRLRRWIRLWCQKPISAALHHACAPGTAGKETLWNLFESDMTKEWSQELRSLAWLGHRAGVRDGLFFQALETASDAYELWRTKEREEDEYVEGEYPSRKREEGEGRERGSKTKEEHLRDVEHRAQRRKRIKWERELVVLFGTGLSLPEDDEKAAATSPYTEWASLLKRRQGGDATREREPRMPDEQSQQDPSLSPVEARLQDQLNTWKTAMFKYCAGVMETLGKDPLHGRYISRLNEEIQALVNDVCKDLWCGVPPSYWIGPYVLDRLCDIITLVDMDQVGRVEVPLPPCFLRLMDTCYGNTDFAQFQHLADVESLQRRKFQDVARW